jgi:hypothetical protein
MQRGAAGENGFFPFKEHSVFHRKKFFSPFHKKAAGQL